MITSYSRVSIKQDRIIAEKLLGTSIVDAQVISAKRTSRTYIKGKKILRVITPSWDRQDVINQMNSWAKGINCEIKLFANYFASKNNVAMLFILNKTIEIQDGED